MQEILLPVIIMGIMGIVFALLLYIASTVFHVPVNPKVQALRDALPGVNCGACGFPGCDGLANAIAEGNGSVTACPVGGEETAQELASIMGQDAGEMEKMVAVVHCQGDKTRSEDKYNYEGSGDCRAISMNLGGNKKCPSGCLGGGSCKIACDFGAIEMVNGVAIVNKDKCTGCEQCVKMCPKHIISMVPYKQESVVLCSSTDKGKEVRGYCSVGCIGCTICAKQYPEGFVIENFLAKASYDYKTVDEEALANAVEKCPNNCISPGDERDQILEEASKTHITI